MDAIRTTAADLEYSWLDVACIDQDDRGAKMAEIGKQAGIFEKAEDSYVWLHAMSKSVVEEVTSTLMRCAARLGGEQTKSHPLLLDILINWDDRSVSDYMEPPLPLCLSDESWAAPVRTSIQCILDDPWFTSLWTLQESTIAAHSWLLCREGQKLEREGGIDCSLPMLNNDLGDILHHIEMAFKDSEFIDCASTRLLDDLRYVCNMVERFGLSAYEYAILLYNSTSYRVCRESLDRIYGIIQVFNLKLCEPRDPSGTYTLPDLELEFASELNKKSPIWAQLFRHTKRSNPAQTWMITQFCELPPALRFDVTFPRSECTYVFNAHGQVHFCGRACSLYAINQQWMTAASSPPPRSDSWGWGSVHMIVLDESEYSSVHVAEQLQEPAHIDSPNHTAIVKILLDLEHENIGVFVLGKLLQPDSDSNQGVH